MSTLPSRRRRAICVAMAGMPLFSAQAAEFPGSVPIKLVVPFPPGGLVDAVARLLAVDLAEELKGTVIVDNTPGAAGTIGVARVARATPDGHTLVMGLSATHAIAPALYKDLPYKPEQDFTPIGRTSLSSLVIVAHPGFQANNIQEMLALARKRDGQRVYAAWGVGSGGHLTMESINHHAKVRLEQVPYKGEAQILQALIGGEVTLGVASVGGALPFLKSGKLKALGVGGARRPALLPEVPTLAEQGVPFESSSWTGIFAPAKTPPEVTEKLARALAAVLARPKVQERLRDLGADTEIISREAFARQVRNDTSTWAHIVTVSGVKLE